MNNRSAEDEDDVYTLAFLKRRDFHSEYRLGNKLGEGGFGCVFLANRNIDRKDIAVKIYFKKCTDRHMAMNEMKTLRLLNHHPNSVAFIDYYEDDICYYICMELISGGELFYRIAKGKLHTEELARIWCQSLLNAVLHCHQNSIIHRDIKPENIMMKSNKINSDIKLVDFGLSVSTNSYRNSLEEVGTKNYKAPEMNAGNFYNTKVDLWSVGVIAFLLLGGYLPFHNLPLSPIDNNITMKSNINSKIEINYDLEEAFARRPNIWAKVSKQAKSFISNLLVVDYHKRFCAIQALQHEWFKMNAEELAKKSLTDTLTELKTFNAHRKVEFWIKAFLAKKCAKKWIHLTRSRKENSMKGSNATHTSSSSSPTLIRSISNVSNTTSNTTDSIDYDNVGIDISDIEGLYSSVDSHDNMDITTASFSRALSRNHSIMLTTSVNNILTDTKNVLKMTTIKYSLNDPNLKEGSAQISGEIEVPYIYEGLDKIAPTSSTSPRASDNYVNYGSIVSSSRNHHNNGDIIFNRNVSTSSGVDGSSSNFDTMCGRSMSGLGGKRVMFQLTQPGGSRHSSCTQHQSASFILPRTDSQASGVSSSASSNQKSDKSDGNESKSSSLSRHFQAVSVFAFERSISLGSYASKASNDSTTNVNTMAATMNSSTDTGDMALNTWIGNNTMNNNHRTTRSNNNNNNPHNACYTINFNNNNSNYYNTIGSHHYNIKMDESLPRSNSTGSSIPSLSPRSVNTSPRVTAGRDGSHSCEIIETAWPLPQSAITQFAFAPPLIHTRESLDLIVPSSSSISMSPSKREHSEINKTNNSSSSSGSNRSRSSLNGNFNTSCKTSTDKDDFDIPTGIPRSLSSSTNTMFNTINATTVMAAFSSSSSILYTNSNYDNSNHYHQLQQPNEPTYTDDDDDDDDGKEDILNNNRSNDDNKNDMIMAMMKLKRPRKCDESDITTDYDSDDDDEEDFDNNSNTATATDAV